MRRIMVLVTVGLVMAAIMAFGAGAAFADKGGLRGHTGSAGGCLMVSGGSGGPGGGGGLHDTVCSEDPPTREPVAAVVAARVVAKAVGAKE